MIHSIAAYMDHHRQEMLALLETLVGIQSGSKNKAGLDRVGRTIAREMEAMGFSCQFQDQTEYGNHLVARSPGNCSDKSQGPGKKPILITGHMDTVFPFDTAFNYYKEDEARCFGPGVADMKGGLVVGIFALKALKHTRLMPETPITFIFNSDEEIGSPSSRDLIQREARASHFAYVLEAGGLSGQIVAGRKGNMSIRLAVEGQAGHAAFAEKHKASAILELAHKIIAIERLNDPDCGITANVGTIEGGLGPNTIAQHAKAAIDVRYIAAGDENRLLAKIREIAALQTIPGTCCRMTLRTSRPAMPLTEANMDLFRRIKGLADGLGICVVPELRQGVSDANVIAHAGIPVIDGLGPMGAKDHSEDEYIEKKSLWERAVLFANILAAID
ncbi:MAG: M20 family metallopeptidase [Proteobacteria bacterium]|nr:M20 family metallopeptidase [Pseudomonadota bacterium]